VNDKEQIQALVDKTKVIITEDIIRSDLRFDDAEGTTCLLNEAIFEGLARMGTIDAGTKAPEVDESEASDNDGKNDQVSRSEVEGLPQQARQTENINSPNSFNIVSSHVNTFGSSFVNAASQTPINAARPFAGTNVFKEHSFE
nr:hypothetical protein [Tanacetum cinerariifolium]